MKKLGNSEGELKKALFIKKTRVYRIQQNVFEIFSLTFLFASHIYLKGTFYSAMAQSILSHLKTLILPVLLENWNKCNRVFLVKIFISFVKLLNIILNEYSLIFLIFWSSRSPADLLTVVSDRIFRAFNRSGATRAAALDIYSRLST